MHIFDGSKNSIIFIIKNHYTGIMLKFLFELPCVQMLVIRRLRNDLYCVEWDVKLYYTMLVILFDFN